MKEIDVQFVKWWANIKLYNACAKVVQIKYVNSYVNKTKTKVCIAIKVL